MPIRRRKVFVYITSGERVLLLFHPHHPEAGIQVPAGTMRDGEDVPAAALREAAEETGLAGLELVGILGEQVFDARPYGKDELHHRVFVHLACHEETPERWEHWETDPDDAPGERILFELAWAELDDTFPALIAGHDALIPALMRDLDLPG